MATADAALAEVQDHLREVDRLMLAAASTRSPAEVAASQRQIDQLVARVDEVLRQTRFAGRPMFVGEPVQAPPPPLGPGVQPHLNQKVGGSGTSNGSSGTTGTGGYVVNNGPGFADAGDYLHYRSTNFAGDATGRTNITAAVDNLLGFPGGSPLPGSQTGVMIRNGTSATAPFAALGHEAGTGLVFTYRNFGTGPITRHEINGVPLNAHLRLQRDGDAVSAEYSTNGVDWTQVSTATVNLITTPKYGIYTAAGPAGGGPGAGGSGGGGGPFARGEFGDVQIRPGIIEYDAGGPGRPYPEAGTLSGDPPEGVSQTAFAFNLGGGLPRGLTALRFATTRAADLGAAGVSLLDLQSGRDYALDTRGPSGLAQNVLDEARRTVGHLRAHAGRFEQTVVDPAAAAASEAALQLADADATLTEANVAADVAERTKINALQLSSREAIRIAAQVSRFKVETLI